MYSIPFERSLLDSALAEMHIADIARATIRQSGDVARAMEHETGTEFLHLEMGIPGLEPYKEGVEAEIAALRGGIASQYPNMYGAPALKEAASRFLKAFVGVDIAPRHIIPTVGSMQGSFTLFLMASQMHRERRKILFINPGFPVQRSQVRILGIPSEAFDIYDCRGEKLGAKIESYLATGEFAAMIYSNPNNPAWVCLTEEELRGIGRLATKYDVVAIEDLAYMGMDFRKELGHPFTPPHQASVARYTDNYILMCSASKIFSYAGQRIAVMAFSDKLFTREYENLRDRYNMPCLGDAYALTFLYAASSGTSHSAQMALTAMFNAAADGRLDFVGGAQEYARRAKITKDIFLRHGFHLVYDRDGDEPLGDGFFYTVGYGSMSSARLLAELLLYGICAITLTSTGSHQEGIRVCISQLVREEQFAMLEERLKLFNENHCKI